MPNPSLPLLLDLLFTAALGALQTLAFVNTRWWPLPFACIAALSWRVNAAKPKRAASLGWAFGTGWLLAGTWWLFISLHRYGELPAWMAATAVFALCALLSIYLALAMAAFARYRSGRAGADALLFATVWMLAELARAIIFTGFPWVATGYSQVDAPLSKLAPWVGVYGIGFTVAGLSAWAAFALRDARAKPSDLLWPGSVSAALMAGGAVVSVGFTQPTTQLSVTLIQGNIPQEEKFAAERQGGALTWHLNTLLAAQSDLVIAPETAIPVLPQQLPPDLWRDMSLHFKTQKTYALVGVPMGNDDAGYTNSAVGFGPKAGGGAGTSTSDYRYDKHHLVPFGEFIPTGFKWFTRMMNIPLGDFNRGPVTAPSFKVKAERVAPNICYEDLFGEDLAARFVDAATAPTMFANLSNIGWFGNSIAIPQHLNLSRMRALEFQVPMLRATNTGATAVIDHQGVVTKSLPPHQRGVLQASVQGRSGVTPFAWWASRFYLWPLIAFAALVLLWRAFKQR
ncbi:MAG: apolipoprotein N-acyltransferase [Pseudorhodobacter sp.]|nr:apolipoprotein N-acyltransferase [Rhizobacter sp.]